jgi:replication factor C subunit 1
MKQLKYLELLERSAKSISDGDLVDSMIHGPEQHWTLMPLHAVTSTVYPASQVYGTGGHWGSDQQFSFPGCVPLACHVYKTAYSSRRFLGQNSKMGALKRQLGEVQARMRSKVSADKTEIRTTYIPMMNSRLVKPLIDVGAVSFTFDTLEDHSNTINNEGSRRGCDPDAGRLSHLQG